MLALSDEELLFLQDLCLDGEFRSHQRAAQAQLRGDFHTAAYEVQVKEQFTQLKAKLRAALEEQGFGRLAASTGRRTGTGPN